MEIKMVGDRGKTWRLPFGAPSSIDKDKLWQEPVPENALAKLIAQAPTKTLGAHWGLSLLQQIYNSSCENALCCFQLRLSYLLPESADTKTGLLDRASSIFY